MKAFFSFIIFLLLATGFFFLIRFEIQYGVAGGKFGGVEVNTMPFTFWFFIGLQVFLGLTVLVNALKELRNIVPGKSAINHSGKNSPYLMAEAMFWIFATLFLAIRNLLAICSVFEMAFNMYGLIRDDEMPRKAIPGVLFLICLLVFCYLFYVFLFRSLTDTFFPKARKSFFSLRKHN